jgi:prepilin-type N-terminal cleavage/methylation domain-containing protein
MKNTNLNKKAFTLVELLVVIAIIAILFVVLISKVDFATDKAKESGVQTDFRSFQMAIHTVGIEQQGFTDDLELLALQINQNLDNKLKVYVVGETMVSNAKDPWGTEYKLTYSEPESTRGEVTVHSAGPDMQFNTADDERTVLTYMLNEGEGAEIVISSTSEKSNGNASGSTVPVDYEMLSGKNAVIEKPTLGVFRSAANIDSFVEVKVDNVTVDSSNYEVTEGSIIITFTPEFLESLNSGNHSIEIVSNNGSAKGEFETTFSLPGFYDTNNVYTSWEDIVLNGIISVDNGVVRCNDKTISGKIVLPHNVTTIGKNAFSQVLGLTEIVISESVTKIDENAFSGCKGLTSISIPGSVYMIANYAFTNCSNLKNVDLGEGVNIINHYVFEGCSAIESLHFPNSITYLGYYAFQGCSKLSEVVFGEKLNGIGNGTFYKCTNLKSIYIPASVNAIGIGAFGLCSNLESINVSEENSKYKDVNGHLYTKDGKTFMQYALGNKDESYSIEEGVISIYDWAFRDCTNLKEIVIPNGCERINSTAFSGCKNAVSISVPNTVQYFGSYAFSNCESLEAINIPNGVTKIEVQLFYCCYKLANIVIPDSVTSIDGYAFYRCYALKTVDLGSGVKTIAQMVFWDCASLESINLPTGIESIEYGCFQICPKLTEIFIPSTVTYMGENMFSNGTTVYCEAESVPTGWNPNWNSANCSVIWGHQN